MLHSAVHPQQPAIKSRFHFVTYPARTKWILTQRLAKNIKLRMFNNSLAVPSNLDKQLSVDSQYFSDANPTICPLTHFHLKWYSTKIPHSETYLRQEFRKPAVYCWTLERWCFFSLLSSGIFIFSEYHSCCCKKKKKTTLPYHYKEEHENVNYSFCFVSGKQWSVALYKSRCHGLTMALLSWKKTNGLNRKLNRLAPLKSWFWRMWRPYSTAPTV